MICKEIVDRFRKKFGKKLPIAYHHFNNSPGIPFCVYYVVSAENRGADKLNLLEERTYRIELYTDYKNEELEEDIAEMFNDREISRDEIYLPDQQLYMVAFQFDAIFKLTGGKKNA